MLRRSILELSRHRGSPRKIPRQIISQCSSPFLYSRKQFSTSPGENPTPKPGSSGGPPESNSGFSRVVLGSAVIVGAALVAYQAGYLDQYFGQVPNDSVDSAKIGFDGKDENDVQVVTSHDEEIKGQSNLDLHEQEDATRISLPPQLETSSETPSVNHPNVEVKVEVKSNDSNETLGNSSTSGPEKPLPEYSQSSLPSADHSADAAVSAEGNVEKAGSETAPIPNKEIRDIQLDTQSSASLGEKETKAVEPHSHATEDRPQELKRERTKAAAALKSLQEKMEEQLRMELEEKEREAELKLQKAQELGKAELAAAIANEKAAQIEKLAEANLNINALCMAFYARSEEAHKSHSVHKLALGALALEDALSKGLPIQKEIDALRTYLEGTEKDSVLDLVLSSLPEETRYHGTHTVLQLNQKFNALKGTLRHFSLIPPGGGGILTHCLAHIASWLKVKEVDQSGEGIESLIGRVDKYLAEGKLAEAATVLEQGVKGSQAEEIVNDWVKQARNRAITEQALTALQSYATCISLT
ncbi:hypothetical protein ES288_A11G226500v1 [Gossypium darwinii]|uniref:MICOS complex subunit MIC60 n=1 Tax=Gossypium darwinii TaxID=34276 RepID=A0A5D2EP97_GOSDA|nr:hypothetical protein ES288_A11G226500v1 [Gossypium darwinii]